MEGKRYLFYDNTNGEILVEEARNLIEYMPTVERVVAIYPRLSERDPTTYDVLVLSYSDYTQDFAECNAYRVNPETKELEFSYPDPNEPEVPQPYIVPLSEQISANTDYLLNVDFRLLMAEMGLM